MKAKGGRTRRKIEKHYRDLGYLVANVEKGGKFNPEKDLFALSLGEGYTDKGFDLICMKQGEILFVQCKTNKPATRKFYKEFARMYASDTVKVIVAVWYDYKGLLIQEYTPSGEIIVEDLRN